MLCLHVVAQDHVVLHQHQTSNQVHDIVDLMLADLDHQRLVIIHQDLLLVVHIVLQVHHTVHQYLPVDLQAVLVVNQSVHTENQAVPFDQQSHDQHQPIHHNLEYLMLLVNHQGQQVPDLDLLDVVAAQYAHHNLVVVVVLQSVVPVDKQPVNL